MRKLIFIAAAAATSLVAAASAAHAGVWWYGVWYPNCFINYWGGLVCW